MVAWAVERKDGLLHLAGFREAHVREQMSRLAVHGHGHLGPHHLVHALQLFLGGMPGDVHEMILLGEDLDAEMRKLVVQAIDRPLVARNDPRGEDHGISRFEHDVGVLVIGDAGKSRARLALATRANQQRLVAREIARLLLGQEPRHALQVSGLPRRLLDTPERATDQRHLPVVLCRGGRDRREPRHVAGEARDGDAVAALAHQGLERAADLRLGPGLARPQGVGAIADHGEHALVAEAAQRRLVRRGSH